ncbi:hypothetical protein [Haloechinothrix aidingensis]|uniref:hypothetical protein n=1 Tax=Haloechinothrix aidingensis TaxID=2752311 RepID=UPI001C60E5BF|nr:hypothetical protein [Haloechinothrix aidingensis]
MGSAFVVRYETTPEAADENQALVEAVFAQLAEQRPAGLSYASFRLDDGVTFVHVGCIEGDGNPLAASTAFHEFQREFRARAPEGPVASGGVLVGSYGFGGEAAAARPATASNGEDVPGSASL